MRLKVSAGGDRIATAVGAALVALVVLAPSASAAVSHVVQPGESLWSIAAANGLSAASVASYNGLSEEAMLISGDTIQVPAAGEAGTAATTTSGGGHTVQLGESLSSVAAANGITIDALASANGLAPDAFLIEGQTITIPAPSATTTSSTTYGLDPAAGAAWEAMRQESLATYGIDLYPAGPLSAYRTYEQQAMLYQQYLDGVGAPANPPGTSAHEFGIAVDLPDPAMRDVVDQIGAAYGWYGIVSEWWHVQYGG